jgi:hypothetical protein
VILYGVHITTAMRKKRPDKSMPSPELTGAVELTCAQ